LWICDDMEGLGEWLSRCAEAQQREQPFPEVLLFRQILEHKEPFWVSTSGPQPGADVWLDEASSEDAEATESFRLVAALPPGLPALRFHSSASSSSLVCKPAQIELLRATLQVIVIEQLLRRLYAGADLEIANPFARLREFEHYYVLCSQPEGQDGALSRMALAPDPQGSRRLAAAFTAQDALQLFVAARPAPARQSEQLVAATLSGRELFSHLATADIEGVVFNPAGPGQPVPLLRSIAHTVLTEDS